MDTKTYPNLNPKLKETYDRIMGVSTTGKPSTHAAAGKHAPSAAHAAPHHTQTTPAHQGTPGHLSHLAYNASMAKKEKSDSTETKEAKNDSFVLPLILAVGGIIFFAAYAFFWINFFGL